MFTRLRAGTWALCWVMAVASAAPPSSEEAPVSWVETTGTFERVLAETAGAVTGGIAGAAAAALFGLVSCELALPYELGCLERIFLPTFAGFALLTPVGAWTGAQLAHASGQLPAALIGAYLGFLAGALLQPAWFPQTALDFVAWTLPWVGAVVAVEWSHRAVVRRRAPPVAVSIQPFLGPRGGGFGLVAIF